MIFYNQCKRYRKNESYNKSTADGRIIYGESAEVATALFIFAPVSVTLLYRLKYEPKNAEIFYYENC